MRVKNKEQIMREFIRVYIVTDKSYLRGLLFCLGLNYKLQTYEHILAVVKEFKEELKNSLHINPILSQ